MRREKGVQDFLIYLGDNSEGFGKSKKNVFRGKLNFVFISLFRKNTKAEAI